MHSMKSLQKVPVIVLILGSRVGCCLLFFFYLLCSPSEAAVSQLNPQPIGSACSSSDSIDWSDHEGTSAALAQIYGRESFDQLEASLQCLSSAGKQFASGRPGPSAIYAFYKLILPGPGADPVEGSRIEKWAKAFPKSSQAHFARARFAYAMAWNRRGGTFANEVKEESWKEFREGLRQAEEILHHAPEELHNTPIYYHLLLAIAQDSNRPFETRLAIFQAGVSRWPEYYGLYENMLKRFVPKWGGSWAIVDQSIRTWASQRVTDEGASLYSRLYARVLLDGAKVEETMIQWPTMKASLEDLVKRYPDSYNWSLAASSACLFGDRALFQLSMEKLSPNRVQASAWFRGTAPDICIQRFR